MLHLLAVLSAAPAAIAAVLVSGIATFTAEAVVAQVFVGYDLLNPGSSQSSLAPGDALVVYTTGVFVSLPLTFVPFAALFDGNGFADAFRSSFLAFRWC